MSAPARAHGNFALASEQFLPERVALLYRLSGADTAMVLAIAVVGAFALWEALDNRLLIAWAIWLIAGSVVRIALRVVYHRKQPPVSQAARWEHIYCLAGALLGTAWGASLLMLGPHQGSAQEVIITFAISCISMGLPSSLAPSPKTFVSFMLPILAPVVAVLFSSGGGLNTTVGLLVLLFSAALLAFYGSAHRALISTLSYAQQNAQLLEKLQAAERSLSAALVEQERIFETASAGLALVRDGRVVKCNRRFAEICGDDLATDAAQFVRNAVAVHEADAQSGGEFYRRIAQADEVKGEWKLDRGDGATVWIVAESRALEPANPPAGVIVAVLDITARKQAEAELFAAMQREKEMNEMKSRFVSMASHEFRTPLSGILSSTELLEHFGDKLDASQKAELIRGIADAVKRLNNLVNDVLVMGRSASGKLHFSPAPVDLRSLCGRVASEIRLADSQEHEIRLDYAVARQDLEMDEQLLALILTNLLSNATKYSALGSNVELKVVEEGADIRFDVVDHGIGIPPEDHARLFVSFYRASNVGQRPGTGLGLAIVKSAVETHGGRTAIDSRLGEGTTFRVTLPAKPPTAE